MYQVYQKSDLSINHWVTPPLIVNMRELYMKSGQGFLLVFSITSLSSFHELHVLRDQIIRIKNVPHVPLVLVGNQSDLEEDRLISRSRAFQVSHSWNNTPYYETSARTKKNVDEAFIDLCRQVMRKDVPGWEVREMEMQNLKDNDKLGGAVQKAKMKEISELKSRCNIM